MLKAVNTAEVSLATTTSNEYLVSLSQKAPEVHRKVTLLYQTLTQTASRLVSSVDLIALIPCEK